MEEKKIRLTVEADFTVRYISPLSTGDAEQDTISNEHYFADAEADIVSIVRKSLINAGGSNFKLTISEE